MLRARRYRGGLTNAAPARFERGLSPGRLGERRERSRRSLIVLQGDQGMAKTLIGGDHVNWDPETVK